MQDTFGGGSFISTKELTKMSAVDRSRVLRVARMEPHLQVRPLLLLPFELFSYDTPVHVRSSSEV
jgi:hypothetical protein